MMRLFICFSLAVVTLLSAFANAQAAPHEHCWWSTATTATLELIFWSSADWFSGEDKTHLTLR